MTPLSAGWYAMKVAEEEKICRHVDEAKWLLLQVPLPACFVVLDFFPP